MTRWTEADLNRQKSPPAPRSAAAIAQETQSRAAVVGPGRLAWVNPVFGIEAHYRKFRLLDAGQAAELDAAFYRITNMLPNQP